MPTQITLIHYISAAYILISLLLMMTRKYKARALTMLPPIAQVASVVVLAAMDFPVTLAAPLLLANIVIVFIVNRVEKKLMGTDFAEFVQEEHKDEVPAYKPEKQESFTVDAGIMDRPVKPSANSESDVKKDVSDGFVDLPDVSKSSLSRPESSNRPINDVSPVQQQVFEASEGEVEQIIEKMLSSGDVANAKRYLRMLAFFAKDEPSRKLAEQKLAEISAS